MRPATSLGAWASTLCQSERARRGFSGRNLLPVQQPPAIDGAEGDVQREPCQRQSAAAIDEEPELCRQDRRRRRIQRAGDLQRLGRHVRVSAEQRRDEDGRTVIRRADRLHRRREGLDRLWPQAADLEVGAVGDLDPSVAVTRRRLGHGARDSRRDHRLSRPDAHQPPVAGFHRPQQAGAPAPLELRARHSAAMATLLRRGRQRSRARASRNRACSTDSAAGLASLRKSVTDASPSVAS